LVYTNFFSGEVVYFCGMKNIPSWLDTKEYPFAPHTLQIDGHDLHYIDEGAGKVLLFVHGTPS
jgi:hypothetical protein